MKPRKPYDSGCARRVLAHLSREPSTVVQVGLDLRINPSTVYAAVRALAQRKQIECIARGRMKCARVAFVWALPGTPITPAIMERVELEPIEPARPAGQVERAIAAQPPLAVVWNPARGLEA